jgi:hypothetical protein
LTCRPAGRAATHERERSNPDAGQPPGKNPVNISERPAAGMTFPAISLRESGFVSLNPLKNDVKEQPVRRAYQDYDHDSDDEPGGADARKCRI